MSSLPGPSVSAALLAVSVSTSITWDIAIWVLMAVLACGPRDVVGLRLWQSAATSRVLGTSDDFHVLDVLTCPVAAQMIDGPVVVAWDRADRRGPDRTVCPPVAALPADVPVALALSARPFNAAIHVCHTPGKDASHYVAAFTADR
jgi:hypothetical protein